MKKLLTMFIAALLLIVPQGFAQAGGNDVCESPLDVMLVLDRSGSMSGTPIADEKTAAKALVDELNESTDQVGVASFASTASLDHVLDTPGPSQKTAIDTLSAGGCTNIGDGIGVGHDELADNDRGVPQVLVLLSDGVPNEPFGGCFSPSPADEAFAESEADDAKTDGVVIFTIALGAADADFMEGLASDSSKAFDTPDSDELEDIFIEIASDICDIPPDDTLPPVDVPEFTFVGGIFALAGMGATVWHMRRRK